MQVVLLYGTVYLIFMWAVWLPVEDYWVGVHCWPAVCVLWT